MAQLIGLLGTILFFSAVGLYALYVFRRFGPPRTTPWPRGKRLVFFCVLLVLTGVVVVPAAIVAVGHAFGMTTCRVTFSPGEPWACSPIGRLTFLVGTLAAGLPLAAIWLRFLLGRAVRESQS
jgi:hypothetical protein